jgi:3-deoxy-manno-octulosonate cytidylyltransferase (CMP-KDO synthetase)
MKTLAVLPARLGATRLPHKPLRLLGGAPLIVRVWQRVRDLGVVDEIVIATDTPLIVDAAREAGATAVLTDPNHPSGTDRVAEVATRPEFADADVIVNVQGDEPFVSQSVVARAIDLVRSGAFPLGTIAVRADARVLDDPNIVKVVTADDGRALYFSRASIPWLRDPADRDRLGRSIRQHVGIYAYTREALAAWVSLPPHPLEQIERLEQLRPLAAGIAMGVATVDEPPEIGVDTEDDLVRANQRWTELLAGRT